MSETLFIKDIVNNLCSKESYENVYYKNRHDIPMPSIKKLNEIMDLLREIIFPGYFGYSEFNKNTMDYFIGFHLEKIYNLLFEEIKRGFCFTCNDNDMQKVCIDCEKKSKDITKEFILKIPKIRELLSLDVKAAFSGDPAVINIGEIVYCYPSIYAITNHRIAHELLLLDVPLIPRIISELAHSKTGIDIHPGASIDESFFIDHGTGTVIGETCIIGKKVRIYQGVTLGAKSFSKDIHGNLVKKIPRHPIVEDNVIIYSGATILGRITLGENSVIGGNVFLTKSIPKNSKILQAKNSNEYFENGTGI